MIHGQSGIVYLVKEVRVQVMYLTRVEISFRIVQSYKGKFC